MVRPVRPWESPEDNIVVLSTSFVPNNAEVQALKSRKEARLAQLSRIEASFDYSSRAVALRRALWNSNIVADGLLAPVRRLPAEILGEVLTLCIPQVSIEKMMGRPAPRPYKDGEYPSDVRRNLRQVCRQWNIVALGTPSVWSSLTVDLSLDIDEVKLCLVRSRACLLHIYMEGEYQYYEPRDPRIDVILDLLRPQLHRIRHLVYTYPTDTYICDLFPEGQIINAPNLEVLVAIAYKHPRDLRDGCHNGLGGIHSPNIQTIWIDDSPSVLTSFSIDSLRNVRRLIIACPIHYAKCARRYLTVLAPCSSVTELELWSVTDMWEEEEEQLVPYIEEKVSLPHLKSLIINVSADDEIEVFLSRILVPSLEVLHIQHSDPVSESRRRVPPYSPSDFERGLEALQNHIVGSLRDLKIDSINLVRDPGPIPRFANLVSLHLKEIFIGDTLLDALTPAPSSTPWPCPLLETLTFTGVTVSLPGDGLITLIRNRTCDDTEDNTPAHCTFIRIDGCQIIEDIGFNYLELGALAHSRRKTLQIKEYVYVPPIYDWDSDSD